MFGGSASSSTSNVTHSDAASIISARKKSRDYETSIYPNSEMFYDDASSKLGTSERKKSGGSSHSKGKSREKSEASLLYQKDGDKVLYAVLYIGFVLTLVFRV
jgi:hypothetical protein